jgi:hypothetical protein
MTRFSASVRKDGSQIVPHLARIDKVTLGVFDTRMYSLLDSHLVRAFRSNTSDIAKNTGGRRGSTYRTRIRGIISFLHFEFG